MQRWLLILLCTLPLLACGQKGPLRLPDAEPSEPTQEQPTQEQQDEQPEQQEGAS